MEAETSALAMELRRLLGFLDTRGLRRPTRSILMVEIPPGTPVDSHGRLRVRRSDFCEPTDFAARFDELLASGMPWLSLCCCGVDGDALIVTIETPRAWSTPAPRPSVNLSGPARKVIASGWRVDQTLAIE